MFKRSIYATLALVLLAAAPAEASAPSGVEQEVQTVNVSLFEWGITTSTAQVPAGPVEFVIRNDGDVGHAFKIAGNGIEQETDVFGPGETRTLRVTLPPGAYDLWCPVPGHRALGMEAPFSAQQSPTQPPGGDTSIEEAVDTNGNGFIDDGEVIEAIRLWINGTPVPGAGRPINDAEMTGLIRLWATGGPIQA